MSSPINWTAVNAKRMQIAEQYGENAAKLADAGDVRMAYYYAMQAAHELFKVHPELAE